MARIKSSLKKTDGEKPKEKQKNKPEVLMVKALKVIAVTILILAGLVATAIKEMQDAEIDQQIALNLLELWKEL